MRLPCQRSVLIKCIRFCWRRGPGSHGGEKNKEKGRKVHVKSCHILNKSNSVPSPIPSPSQRLASRSLYLTYDGQQTWCNSYTSFHFCWVFLSYRSRTHSIETKGQPPGVTTYKHMCVQEKWVHINTLHCSLLLLLNIRI